MFGVVNGVCGTYRVSLVVLGETRYTATILVSSSSVTEQIPLTVLPYSRIFS